MKASEGDWVTNHYNDCGYRTAEPCSATDSGTKRVALLGSSIALGFYVPYNESMSAVLASNLTNSCKEPVVVQNLASEFEFGSVLSRRFDLALQLKPAAIVIVASPLDIEDPDPLLPQGAASDRSLAAKVKDLVRGIDPIAPTVIKHFLYEDADYYLSLFEHSPTTMYMHNPFSPDLAAQLQAYAVRLGQMAAKARQENEVPVMLVYVPQRAQVGFAAGIRRPADIDPFALNRALADIAERNGIAFVDTTAGFVDDPRKMDLFYPADGHPNNGGDAVAANAIAAGMMNKLPPFKPCSVRSEAAESPANQG